MLLVDNQLNEYFIERLDSGKRAVVNDVKGRSRFWTGALHMYRVFLGLAFLGLYSKVREHGRAGVRRKGTKTRTQHACEQ